MLGCSDTALVHSSVALSAHIINGVYRVYDCSLTRLSLVHILPSSHDPVTIPKLAACTLS